MKKFQIEIKEYLSKVVEVHAESHEDAIRKTKELYKQANIVLDYNDFTEVEFLDVNTLVNDNG